MCGILGHTEINDFAAVAVKHDQGLEEANVVAAMNKSIGRLSVGWLRRKLRQVGEAALGRRAESSRRWPG